MKDQITEIPINEIYAAEWQPREDFDEESIKELGQSLKEKGIIQPIVVRKHENGYQIIAGERRWRASKLIGKETIPTIIKDVDDFEAKEISIIENWQRKDLNYHEKEKFIYGLWIDGSKNKRYTSHNDMSRKTSIPRQTIDRIILAVEERNSISNGSYEPNVQKIFRESNTEDLIVTRTLKDDVDIRAEVLQIRVDKKIGQKDLHQVSKAVVTAPQETRKEIVKLIDEEKLKPKDVVLFVKLVNDTVGEARKNIIDMIKDGQLKPDEIETFIKLINDTPKGLYNDIITLIRKERFEFEQVKSFVESINVAPKMLCDDIFGLVKNEHIGAEQIEELVRIINISPNELRRDVILALKDERIKLEQAEKFIHDEVEVLRKLREKKNNWVDVEEVAKIADAMKAKQSNINVRTQQVENIKESKLGETIDSKSEKIDSSKQLINIYNEALQLIIPNFNLERMNKDKKYRDECIPFVQKFTKYFEDLINN